MSEKAQAVSVTVLPTELVVSLIEHYDETTITLYNNGEIGITPTLPDDYVGQVPELVVRVRHTAEVVEILADDKKAWAAWKADVLAGMHEVPPLMIAEALEEHCYELVVRAVGRHDAEEAFFAARQAAKEFKSALEFLGCKAPE